MKPICETSSPFLLIDGANKIVAMLTVRNKTQPYFENFEFVVRNAALREAEELNRKETDRKKADDIKRKRAEDHLNARHDGQKDARGLDAGASPPPLTHPLTI